MNNLYLFVVLHIIVASVLALVGFAIALFFDFITLPAIIGSFAAGFLLAFPVTLMVKKKIVSE